MHCFPRCLSVAKLGCYLRDIRGYAVDEPAALTLSSDLYQTWHDAIPGPCKQYMMPCMGHANSTTLKGSMIGLPIIRKTHGDR